MNRSVFILTTLTLLASFASVSASVRDKVYVLKKLDLRQAGPFEYGTKLCNADPKGLTYSCQRPLPYGSPVTLGELVSRHTTFDAAKRLNRWPAHFTANMLLPDKYRGKIYVASDTGKQITSK